MSEPITCTNQRWYPAFHIAAPGGWINDPNGLCFFNGRYHAFYQHHPYSAQWGPMHWGHASSDDLAHWRHEPIALAPGAPGSDDADGIWSGSAFEHDGTLYVFYTGNRWANGTDGADGIYQTQMLATSTDGIHFEKHGAVIPPVKADARDPKVFAHDGRFFMTVGAQVDGRGAVLLYSSTDLHTWHEEGTLYEDPDPNVVMIECPDFFPLGDRWVLLHSPMRTQPIRTGYHLRNGHNAGYIVGDWTPGTRFTPATSYRPADWGHHYYAPQTFAAPDGRRIMFGWMGEFARALACQDDGWSGQLTVPRELSLNDDLSLSSTPSPATSALFGPPTTSTYALQANESTAAGSFGPAKITVSADLDKPVPLQSPTCEQVELSFTRAECSPTRIILDTQALRVHLVYGDGNGAGRGYRSVPWNPGEHLTILVDRSSFEIFVGDGTHALSSLDFSGDGDRALTLTAVNGPADVTVTVEELAD